MQCQKCGIELKDGVKFCPKCGHDVTAPFVEKKPFFSKLLKTIIQNAKTEVWYKRWWVWGSFAVVIVVAGILTASIVFGGGENSSGISADSTKIMYANAQSGLRGRAEPSIDSIRIVTYQYGAEIQILERSSTPVTIDGITDYWYKTNAGLTFEGKYYEHSWVFGGYLSENSITQGTKAGWPTAELKTWSLEYLKQPAGVKSSYTEEKYSLTVYMTGANAKTLQELNQQIEKARGEKMHSETGYCSILVGTGPAGCGYLELSLKGNLLKMELTSPCGD